MTAVAGAETPDDATVVVKLALGARGLPADAGDGTHRWGRLACRGGKTRQGHQSQPGRHRPFVFESWEPGVKWSYTKFPNYRRKGLPYLDKVVYTLISDNQVQSTGLRSREIDAISGPGALAKQFDTLKGADLTIEEAPGLQIFVAYMNGGRPPFNNPALAQAFNFALDREELVQVGTSGHGSVQSGFIPKSHPYFDAAFQPYPPRGDERMAKQKLAEGGMPDGFTCTIDVTNADVFPSMAQAAQAQLAKVGIKATVRLNDSTGTSTRLLVSLDMDAILGTVPVQANLYNTAAQVYATTGGFNPKGQRVPNPQIDALVRQAGAATTEDEARKAYLELQKLVAEDGRNPVFGIANVISYAQKSVRDHPASADGATRLTRVWLNK
ncbi:MAG: ABC transporter substrate-binding protein [Dehalococcoidia bacterium]